MQGLHLLHIFFDYYSANTKNIDVYLKNKFNFIKAHYFQFLNTNNSQHMILTSSQKSCTETCVNNTIRQRKTENVPKMTAKYKSKALQK